MLEQAMGNPDIKKLGVIYFDKSGRSKTDKMQTLPFLKALAGCRGFPQHLLEDLETATFCCCCLSQILKKIFIRALANYKGNGKRNFNDRTPPRIHMCKNSLGKSQTDGSSLNNKHIPTQLENLAFGVTTL